MWLRLLINNSDSSVYRFLDIKMHTYFWNNWKVFNVSFWASRLCNWKCRNQFGSRAD